MIWGVLLALAGCTATFTEADLPEQERRMDEAARSEEHYDEGMEELGGRNDADLDAQEDEVIRESEL